MKDKITGRISGIKRNAVHDGDGLRTTVFMKGCPLRCIWCHNPESLSFKAEVGFYSGKCIGCGSCAKACKNGAIEIKNSLPFTDGTKCTGCFDCTEYCPGDARIGYGEVYGVDTLFEKLICDKPFFDNSGGGVTVSGGECLSQPEFTAALAEKLHDYGISVNIDTCGHAPRSVIERVIPFTDVFLYDIKAIDSAVHKRCTGVDNALILENLRYLIESGCHVEIRYPYVPGYNDAECEAVGQFLRSVGFCGKIKVLGYHAMADGKYSALGLRDTLPDVKVDADDTEAAAGILRRLGLNAVNGMNGD